MANYWDNKHSQLINKNLARRRLNKLLMPSAIIDLSSRCSVAMTITRNFRFQRRITFAVGILRGLYAHNGNIQERDEYNTNEQLRLNTAVEYHGERKRHMFSHFLRLRLPTNPNLLLSSLIQFAISCYCAIDATSLSLQYNLSLLCE